ncbi:MAG TPA: hypothetical protein VFO79_15475 [Xanthomonadales bacterium]|nr:hypothetical protein [Xanthomonadales bacterium]
MRALALLSLSLFALPVHAELTQSAPDALESRHVFRIEKTPAEAWRVLIKPQRYWPRDHTWSGDPGNLSLEARAGGCFCEKWKDASAEHGRVVMSQKDALLRIRGAFGPLQALAVTGVVTVELSAKDGGTEAIVTYRVSGDSLHQLDKFAPVVDKVIGQQFGRFADLATDGKLD